MPARTGNTILTSEGKVIHTKKKGRGKPRSKPVKVSVPYAPTKTGKRAETAAKRRAAQPKAPPASRPVETLRRAEAKLAKAEKPDPKLREATRRLRHALAAQALFKARQPSPEGSGSFPEREMAKVAPRAYKKSARRAAMAGSSGGGSWTSDLENAILLAAPGGGLVGSLGKKAVEEGAPVVAKTVGEAVGKKIEATAAKTTKSVLNAGSGVRAGGRLAGRAALRAAGKDTSKLAEKAALSASQRAARRTTAAIAKRESRAASAAVPGIKAGKVGALGTPVVRGHVEAAIDSPTKVGKKTVVGAEGLAIGAVKAPIDIGATAGRAASTAAHAAHVPGFKGYSGKEILAPVKGLSDEQLAFAHQVAKVVLASDSKMVKREVEDNLGLLLPAMVALGAKAGGERFTKGRIVEGVRKLADKARKEPLGDFRGKTPRVFEQAGQHKTEARRVANAKLRAKREEQGATGRYVHQARGAKGGEVVRENVRPPRGRTKGRLRKGLTRAEGEGHLVVRPADVVPFATRRSIDLTDPARAIEQVKAIRASLKPLPKGEGLSPSKLHTRDLLDYIERNAHILADPKVRRALEERRKAGRYKREHRSELEPEGSERARVLSAATELKIPFPEEMHPKSVRDIVRSKSKRGTLAKDTLRREGKEDHSRARALKSKAKTVEKNAAVARRELEVREKLNKDRLEPALLPSQERELKAQKALERRGLTTKSRPGGHLEAVPPKGPRSLPKGHERLRARIDALDRRAVDLREKATAAEKMGKRKNAAMKEIDPALEKEFVDRVEAELHRRGRPAPEYVHTGVAREGPRYGATGAKMSQFLGKSKFRSGFAEEHGMVQEGLVPDVRESFRRPAVRRESYKALRGMIDHNEFRVAGKDEWKSNEMRELFDAGVLNREKWVPVPRQLYKRAYGKFDPETAIGDMKLALEGKATGSHFKLIRRPAAEEFFSQLSDALVSSKLVHINRATNFMILATSPAWAAAQVVAEYTQGAIAQPKLLNPKWVKRALKAYQEMPPHKRQEFDAWVGVTARELSRKEEMGFGKVEDAADAYSAFHDTPAGKLMFSIQNFDRWKGGRIRTLVTIAKADKELNGHLDGFVQGLGRLDKEMGRQLEAMRGKSLRDQLAFIADHPKWADRYQTYLDDVMGNWTALTKNERVASQLMIFYPFLRMSLRWTFYAFPKHHPIRAMVLAYLSQQNATEIRRLLGGDPSYFTGWLKVPVHLGGKKVAYVPLSRIVPGANALLEALGGNIEGPKGSVALRTAQPLVGGAATLATGVSPLSGKQEKGSFWNAMQQLFPTSLSAPGRALNEALLPSGRKPSGGVGKTLPFLSNERQGALDKLSSKLTGYGTSERYLRNLAMPLLPESGSRVRDKERLGRIIRGLERNSSHTRDDVSSAYAQRIVDAKAEGKQGSVGKLKRQRDKELATMKSSFGEAEKALNKLFERYGIPYKKEDRLFLEAYDEGKYGKSESAADKLNRQLGIPPAASKKDLNRQLGIPSSPSKEELDKQLGIK
jgi:hypothetical protein